MPFTLPTDPGKLVTLYPYQGVEYTTTPTNPDSWHLVEYLRCTRLQLVTNGFSTADLEYEIGQEVMQPGDNAFHEWSPENLYGKYVRITIYSDDPDLEDLVWVGYVLSEDLQRGAVKDSAGVNKYQGERQLFSVVGLEWFLDRKQIDSAVVYKTVDTPSEANPDYVRINRPLKFNGGESQTIDIKGATRGNRSAEPTIDGLYVFSDDPTSDYHWTSTEIVRYLLKYHQPIDKDNTWAPCQYILDEVEAALGYLDSWQPTLGSEKQTVFKLLNEIISPSRGLVWWCEFSSDDGTAMIRIASLATANVELPGGGTFPANANQIALDFDQELDVQRVEVKTLGYRRYHKVTVRGARMTSTFTIGYGDTTLTKDWTDDAEVDYIAGANGDADYAGLTTAKQAERNDAARKRDIFGRVYAYFRLPATWDGKTGDGKSATKDWAFAVLNDSGTVTGGLPLTVPGIRLLNRLRLKLGVDYSDPLNPVNSAPEGALEEFLAPFAIVQVEQSPAIGDSDQPDRWQYIEHMNEAVFHAGTRVGVEAKTSYSLQMQTTQPGIVVKASGSPQHVIALNIFDPDTAEPTKARPQVSYTTLRATVCAEADKYAEGQFVVNPLPAGGVPIEELIIDMGPDYRLDFLAANTVIDVKNGIPRTAGSAAVLRDDRAPLRDIAKMAGQWYSVDRRSMSVVFRQLRNLFGLGMMVTTIGSGTTQLTVNTVISNLVFDFTNGTTTVVTEDQTLDARAFGGRVGSLG